MTPKPSNTAAAAALNSNPSATTATTTAAGISTTTATTATATIPNDYVNQWQAALTQLYKSHSGAATGLPQGNPFAAAGNATMMAMTNPQAFAAAQNMWGTTAQNGQAQGALPQMALQMAAAANGAADASFLNAAAQAQAQALQQVQKLAPNGAKDKGGNPGVMDHDKLAAASVQAAMTGLGTVQDFKVAQNIQSLHGVPKDEENGLQDCQDERELKKQRRKQSNRESARRSRLRKQAECEELSVRVNKLSEENVELQTELEQMKQKCETLTSQNKRLQQELHSFAQGDSKRLKKDEAATKEEEEDKEGSPQEENNKSKE
ncbi:BZIP domain-containing protein [Chloropicon primus]|uniref:BZIP domain-containing protein n=1 Tax=Chloropicon primus TaxID=1764295 RepID=A0A5B8MWH7_9CHLO|nr:hypothetical protein A3770_13p70440 [Chloropicon primus]UPR03734.1 BZIP domain-containing protein [Chloropicon primus]|mmetsp:Transcript_4601/g.13712  ORF Transcript_4601/g.13712 Transcript_4601/m.13712 type:complete len:320 (+) Transcript_4601:266-1225(+)|eukprot:QDZ24526.1 hypothetical protein A3770_13p70440 [Chloropicon primus]